MDKNEKKYKTGSFVVMWMNPESVIQCEDQTDTQSCAKSSPCHCNEEVDVFLNLFLVLSIIRSESHSVRSDCL